MNPSGFPTIVIPGPTQFPVARTSGKPSDQTRSFRIGDKIVRIDSATIDAGHEPVIQPHLRAANLSHAGTTNSNTKTVELATGVIEMGLGHVVENNRALQEAAAEPALKTNRDSHSASIPVQPAWEVEYFPWPRLARRLLETHQELFDQIGNQLLADLQPTRSRIGVCSTFPREGKTTIATCLARWSAMNGKRTLLIDADIERPRMTLMCGLSCDFGWQNWRPDGPSIEESMVRSVESGLVFVPSCTDSRPEIAAKSLRQLGELTFQLKYQFDVVVMDLGLIDNICAHGTDDMDIVDAMLVTRDPSRTSVGQTMDTRRVLHNLGVPRTYIARNFARQGLDNS